MTLAVPLTIRLQTAARELFVTRQARDLILRDTVPGGFASCVVPLNRPLAVAAEEIAAFAELTVYDGRNGNIVFQGRLEDPGRGAGRDGEIATLTAVGPAAYATDDERPYIIADRVYERLFRVDNATPGANNVNNDNGAGLPVITLQFPQGLGIVTDSRCSLAYQALREAGQTLARFAFNHIEGATNNALRVQLLIRGPGATTTVRDDAFSTGAAGAGARVITTDWNAGQDWPELRILRSGGAVTVGDDLAWSALSDLHILATRYSKAGSSLTAAANYTSNNVTADQVVADLLGRLLHQFDGANAALAANSYGIDQLAYPDGTTPAKVLDDLMALEPDYFWAGWEKTAAGTHRFEWTAWPAEVRYEARADAGLDSPASSTDLYDEICIRWRDKNGRTRTVIRTQSVPALTAAGIRRTAYRNLGDEIGSDANAAQYGDAFLAQHATPPNAGSLAVPTRIYDLIAGRYAEPWEIRPGNLIRVHNVLPRLDALNATTRDGATVFRIVGRTYSPLTGAALDLDSKPRNFAAILADTRRQLARSRFR